MKKITFLFAVLVASVASADSYLYWMTNGNESKFAPDDADPEDVSIVARVGYTGTDSEGQSIEGYLNLYALPTDPDGVDYISYADLVKDQTFQNGFYAQLASNVEYSTFIVELFSDSSSTGYVIDGSDPLAYTSASPYIWDGGSVYLLPEPWTASLPVPEPTSGLMLLLGCAVLGLRRRKVAHA